MRLFYKQHGAVSVFLTIILVPVILICSIFVDVSRVRLANAQVSAAEDLAMNTLLSQYDTELNDFYGLMASSQSIDDFYSKIEDYFEITLVSQGIDTENAADYAGNIAGIISDSEGSEDFADFLQMSLLDDTEVEVSALDNGNLANPAMMKNQIVEFMKYRSPINTAADLLGILKDSSEELEKTEDNTRLIEERQAYFKAENKVMEDAKELYDELVEYEALGIDKDYIEQMESDLNGLCESYKTAHVNLVCNWYNTEGYGVWDKKYIDTNVTDDTYDEENLASASKVKSLIKQVTKDLSEFVGAGKAVISDYNTIDRAGRYDIQYWIHMAKKLEETGSYNNLSAKGQTLYNDWAKLQNAYDNSEDGVHDEVYDLKQYDNLSHYGEATISEHYAWLEANVASYYSQYMGGGTAFAKIAEDLYAISKNAIDNGTTNITMADEYIKTIYEKLNNYYDTVQKASDIIDDMQDTLETLSEDIVDYDEKYDIWKADVDALRTDENDTGNIANADAEDIYGTEEKKGEEVSLEELHEKVNAGTIEELSNRLNAINSLLGYFETGIPEYKYNGTPVYKIDSYSKFKKKSGVSEEKIVVNEEKLSQYAFASFKFTDSTQMDYVNVTDSNNPALSVNEPTLYTWVMKQFERFDEEASDDAEDQYDQYDGETDSQAEEAKQETNNGNDNEIEDCENLPSAGSDSEETDKSGDAIDTMGDDLGGTSDVVSGLFGNLGEVLQDGATRLRDDLYTVDYITSMFTYDTMEKEAEQESASEESGETETEDSKEIEFDGVTLTNKELSEENNWSYLNEVEYIMYGNSNTENKAAAYGTIFLIRFALNLPADFQYYMMTSGGGYKAVYGAATAISAATCGILPVGLVQLAIVLALTVAESVADLNSLKEGKKVLLIKGTDDLVVSFNSDNLTNNDLVISKGDSSAKDNRLSLAYSDYLKVLLFLKLLSTTKADAIYQRTADVIQVNMQQKENSSGFLMENANVYFQINAKVEVSPLMLSWSLLAGEEGNPYQDNSWRTINFRTVRGY